MNRDLRTDGDRVGEQYRDDSKLGARMRLHQRFSTNEYPWRQWVFDRLDLPEDARILELGCGTAELWTENHARVPPGWNVTLTDASPQMLTKAKDNITFNLSYTANLNFNFILTDARSLPFGDGEFDAVISNHVLYHVPDRGRVFREVRRALKPCGVFLAATNGEDNMRELALFRGILNSEYRVGDESVAFSLENGAGQLEPWFSEVVLHDREDGLLVTEAGPLVDYLLSMMDVRGVAGRVSGAEFGERVSRLVEAIEGELSTSGAVRVTKSVGLFEARP